MGKNREKFFYNKFLNNKNFKFSQYFGEHDHCEICFDKFSKKIKESLKQGYYCFNDSTNQFNWLCETCFRSFKNQLNFKEKDQVHDVLSWEQFYERFTKNCDEFMFVYKDKELNLVNWFDCNKISSYYGTKEQGFVCSDKYNSPAEFLNNTRYDGKTLKEIWDELR